MSLRKPIPEETRMVLSEDPFMRSCIVLGEPCEGRIEFQHAFTYAGRRADDIWNFLPFCSKHHRHQAKYRALQEAAMRFRVLQFNALEEAERKYRKSDLFRGFQADPEKEI